MDTKYKTLLLLVLLIGLGAGATLTTIENTPPAVAPSFGWSYFDKNDQIIADIDTATISGTVTFKAVLINTPNPAVASVLLQVYRSSDNALMNTWVFTPTPASGIVVDTWVLAFDTTQLADGEYRFDFLYVLASDTGDTNPILLSSLYFNFNDGEGLGAQPEPFDPLLLTLGSSLVLVLALYTVLKRRR